MFKANYSSTSKVFKEFSTGVKNGFAKVLPTLVGAVREVSVSTTAPVERPFSQDGRKLLMCRRKLHTKWALNSERPRAQ